MEHEAHGHNDGGGLIKIGINLTIACLISGTIIAGTFAITAPVAAVERINQQNKAMKELVADAQDFKAVEGKIGWYAALKDGKTVAYVLPAESKGYGGTIKMLTAVSPDGKDLGYKILEANETPGLGDNASKPKFSDQFIGKKAEDLEVVKVPTEKNIQALTGATITSRAVTKGIREAVEEVTAYAASQQK
jgi:electron transport complex protein RnfG